MAWLARPRLKIIHPDRCALLAILAWFALCSVLVWPSADVPIVDDWTYAWSVEHLVATGRLAILPISSVYPVAQILWGALFSLPMGFSFNALRASTVVLAVMGAWALYGMGRELGLGSWRALLATFFVVTNPVAILLTHSFMTDVPFLSLSSLAALMFVRGFARRSACLLWLAGALSIAAVWVRQVGVALPLAAAVVCVWTKDRQLRRMAALPTLSACVAAVAGWLGVSGLLGRTADEAARLDRLHYLLYLGATGYAHWSVDVLLGVSFMLFPMGLSTIFSAKRPWIMAALGAAVLLGLGRATPVFNPIAPHHATLTAQELGEARDLIQGSIASPAYGRALALLAQTLAVVGLAGALAVVRSALRQGTAGALAHPGFKYLLALGACHFALICVLWLFCDRYYLVLLPVAAICVFGLSRVTAMSSAVAVIALGAQAWIGIVGTRDAFEYNRVCRRAYDQLLHAGIRPYDVDAGWSLNGWMLYAHPENLPPGADRARGVPAVTTEQPRPYLLSKSPVAGYEVVRHFEWKTSLWPAHQELFVLRK